MRSLGHIKTVGFAFVIAASACGSSDNKADASVDAKAPTPDAMVAAAYSGTVAVNEIQLFGAPQLGKGQQVNITFAKKNSKVKDHFDTGVPLPPCSANLVSTTAADNTKDTTDSAGNPEVDEGTITITGSTHPLPPCVFSAASKDYVCASGQGSGGTTAPTAASATAGIFTFTDTSGTPATFTALHVGETLAIVGGAGAGTSFGITGAAGAKLGIQAAAAPPATLGAWVTVAGTGLPVGATSAPDGSGLGAAPVFLADADKVKITLAGGHDFTADATGDIEAGDNFDLDAATKALLAAKIDLGTANPISFGCDSANTKCGAAAGTIIVIDSTNATDTTATSLGTNGTLIGNITCAAFGDDPVAVPAAAFKVLKGGNPTKLRISIFRDGLSQKSQGNNSLNVVVGHGYVAFQTP
jgi:hypothetical protein